MNADGVRLHPSKVIKPCKQKNGIICEFGCLDHLRFVSNYCNIILESNSRCDCPKSEKSCIRGINCPFVKDLRAVYDNQTKTLKLYSNQIAEVLKNASLYDKIYLEFGEIGPVESPDEAQRALGLQGGEFIFKSPDKERSVISLQV